MIQSANNQPLRVSTEGGAGPYLDVPVSRLPEIEQLLKRHGIAYWVEEDVISLNDGPEEAVVNLRSETDAEKVNALLDSLS